MVPLVAIGGAEDGAAPSTSIVLEGLKLGEWEWGRQEGRLGSFLWRSAACVSVRFRLVFVLALISVSCPAQLYTRLKHIDFFGFRQVCGMSSWKLGRLGCRTPWRG